MSIIRSRLPITTPRGFLFIEPAMTQIRILSSFYGFVTLYLDSNSTYSALHIIEYHVWSMLVVLFDRIMHFGGTGGDFFVAMCYIPMFYICL